MILAKLTEIFYAFPNGRGGGSRAVMRPIWFFVITAAIFGTMIVASFLSTEPEFAIPVALVALIVLAFWAFNQFLASAALRRNDNDVEATLSDETDPIPTAMIAPDEHSPLGGTGEAHAEISPRDFPKGSPERADIERRAQGQGGTVTGVPADVEESQGGKAEGYEADAPASSRRARS